MKLTILLSVILLNFIFRLDSQTPKPAQMDPKFKNFFTDYCINCHGPKKQKGKTRLDNISFTLDTVQKADQWQKILSSLNSGEMPPEDEKQPTDIDKTNFLEALSVTMVEARKLIGDEGRVGVLRRLNLREYTNTIKDLLGVEPDTEGLPEDIGTGAYDTTGVSLYMSSDQLERYLNIGRSTLTAAIAEMKLSKNPPESKKIRTESEHFFVKMHSGRVNGSIESYKALRLWKASGAKADNLPKGFATVKAANDALSKRADWGFYYSSMMLAMPNAHLGAYLHLGYYFPGMGSVSVTIPKEAPLGKYTIRVRSATVDSPTVPRFIELFYLKDGSKYKAHTVEVREVRAPMNRPQIIEFTVPVTPDSPRHYMIREKQYNSRDADHHKHIEEIFRGNGVGIRPSIWVDWTEIEGPIPDPSVEQRYDEIFGSLNFKGKTENVSTILEKFATKAFRGVKPKASFIQNLLKIQKKQIESGKDIYDSLIEPMAIILASPSFLYLHEPRVQNEKVGSFLTDLEFASRLSYFLWASPPDEQLLKFALTGALRDPKVLDSEVERMIADKKSLNFSTGFTHQWLHMERLGLFNFDFKNFPKFDESTRLAAKNEVYHTFNLLLKENLEASKLLKSDFLVINSVLADYYGIKTDSLKRPIAGMEFRKVTLPPNSTRGGLLSMAAILAMGSDGSVSSPVERGAWVLRKLLNTPPPPAPANVPQLSRLADKKITARERLIAHQEEPQCAQCHRRIDPIGFGLENFDAAGLWREVDTYKPGEFLRRNTEGKLIVSTYPIEPAGSFHKGPSFQNFFELRDLIAKKEDDFLHGLIENLYEYGLGRKRSFLDDTAIDQIFSSSKADGGRLKSVLKNIIFSKEFKRR